MANLTQLLSRAKRRSSDICVNDINLIADVLAEKLSDQYASRFICKKLSRDDDKSAMSGKLTNMELDLLFDVSDVWQRSSRVSSHRLFHPDDVPSSENARQTIGRAPKAFASEDARKLSQYEDDIKRLKERIAEITAEKDKAESIMHDVECAAAETKDHADCIITSLKAERAEIEARLHLEQERLANISEEVEKRKDQIEKITAKYKDAVVDGANKDKAIRKFSSLVPQSDLDVLSEVAGENPSDVDKLVFCYFKALMMSGEGDAKIQTRFDRFDSELFDGFSADKVGLAQRRAVYEKLINAKFTDREVTWDLCGKQYNEDDFSTDDNVGNTVTQVKSALITFKTPGKKPRRAKVRTSPDIQ